MLSSIHRLFCFVAVVFLITVSALSYAQAQNYTITDLGTFKGGHNSIGYSINNRGQVTGQAGTSAGLQHTFRIAANGKISDTGTDLGALAGGDTSFGLGINASGQVTGLSKVDSQDHDHAFRTSATGKVSDQGADLGVSGGTKSIGYAINDSGQVTGYFRDQNNQIRAYRTSGSGKVSDSGTDLGTLGGTFSIGLGINADGQVTGYSTLSNGTNNYAFRTTGFGKISDPGTSLGSLGGSTSQGNAINIHGQVTGFSYLSGNQAYHAFLTTKDGTLDDGTALDLGTLGGTHSEGLGINASGTVVGDSTLTPNDLNTTHAFIYTSVLQDLNDLIPANSGWVLISATSINDYGQITGYGTIKGEQHAFLLNPPNFVPPQPLKLQAVNPTTKKYYDVDGIVCDNLACMKPDPKNPRPDMRNCLVFTLTDYPGAKITASLVNAEDKRTGNKVGTLEYDRTGALVYYPPDEFNEWQHPVGIPQISGLATRIVYLKYCLSQNGQEVYKNTLPIILARPPIILIHGVNSSPAAWIPFSGGVRQYMHVPIVTVNHYDPKNYNGVDYRQIGMLTFSGLFGGNGPVEVGASLLADRIQTTLRQVRNGEEVTDEDQNAGDEVNHNTGENAYLGQDGTYLRLAIRRVDVVGWSYGGIITRWYITPKTGAFARSKSQYQRPGGYDLKYFSANWLRTIDFNMNLPVVSFRHDIRKVITLGSPWRGLPLANYVNEALFNYSGSGLGNAPLLRTKLPAIFPDYDPTINTLVLKVLPYLQNPTWVPSYEVAAVNSKWLLQMIYPSSPPRPELLAAPFDENIAYGSVAGDDNAYQGGWYTANKKIDLYTTVAAIQSPSWFPYLGLEQLSGEKYNLSDGLVPIWSTAIPGSYTIAHVAHGKYLDDTDTEEYVVMSLSDANLRTGKALNNIWNKKQEGKDVVKSFNGSVSYTFDPRTMAPYPQSDLYAQVREVGRLDPEAWADLPHIDRSTLVPTATILPSMHPGKFIVQLVFKNVGNVLVPDAQIIGATLEANELFHTITKPTNSPVPQLLLTIRKGQTSPPIQFEFDKIPVPFLYGNPFAHLYVEMSTPLYSTIKFDLVIPLPP